ncbi:hypothetical protein [Streptomyces barringtoniae]|uniref:hypothetical protein n=1 Tax=Streptomyces barringtoniae TaxID=2892029 RepID=UPI001E3BA5B4|nr:hypothetical protein [Streptomyces barringtoniae]MCC5481093.1 hypothetical protein [Streptomyces barringtoniae]
MAGYHRGHQRPGGAARTDVTGPGPHIFNRTHLRKHHTKAVIPEKKDETANRN